MCAAFVRKHRNFSQTKRFTRQSEEILHWPHGTAASGHRWRTRGTARRDAAVWKGFETYWTCCAWRCPQTISTKLSQMIFPSNGRQWKSLRSVHAPNKKQHAPLSYAAHESCTLGWIEVCENYPFRALCSLIIHFLFKMLPPVESSWQRQEPQFVFIITFMCPRYSHLIHLMDHLQFACWRISKNMCAYKRQYKNNKTTVSWLNPQRLLEISTDPNLVSWLQRNWLVATKLVGFFWALVESCYAHWKLEIDTQNDGLEEVPPTDYRYLGYPVSILNFSGIHIFKSIYTLYNEKGYTVYNFLTNYLTPSLWHKCNCTCVQPYLSRLATKYPAKLYSTSMHALKGWKFSSLLGWEESSEIQVVHPAFSGSETSNPSPKWPRTMFFDHLQEVFGIYRESFAIPNTLHVCSWKPVVTGSFPNFWTNYLRHLGFQ